jgi:hypothetical protein
LSEPTVQIVATPAGEAPLWVREAWVGMTLPLSPGPNGSEYCVMGVLSMGRRPSLLGRLLLGPARRRVTGYRVPSGEAVRRLADHHAEAAAWWRSNVDCLACGDFVFDAPACRVNG